jgi:hypothetical protein
LRSTGVWAEEYLLGVIGPGGSHDSRGYRPNPHRNRTPKDVLRFVVTIVLFVAVIVAVVALFLPVLASAIGIAIGAWAGLAIGVGALIHVLSWFAFAPPVLAGILGILSGLTGAWLVRAVARSEKLGRSFIGSLLSPELLQTNPYGFVCFVLINTAIGYGVAGGIASLGVFRSGTSNPMMLATVLGNTNSDSCLEFISCLITVFWSLGALLVIGAIMAAFLGVIVGAIIGSAFSSIGVATVVHGAAEGVVFRAFEFYRPTNLRSGRFMYLLAGAGIGMRDGIVVGMLTGIVLAGARLGGIIT